MKNLQIVAVQFSSSTKLYHYFTDLPVEIGDFCIALVHGKELALVKICALQVPKKDHKATSVLLQRLDLDQVLYSMEDLLKAVDSELGKVKKTEL